MTVQSEEQSRAARAAHDAFEAWRDAKIRSDRTLAFADCHNTAQLWVRFQNCYLGHGNKIPEKPLISSTATIIRPNFGGAA